MDTVYRLEGSRVVTGPMAGGPWDPKLQHGSAPSALIVAVAEAVPTSVPMRVARLTVDLMRPMPVAPLEIRTDILREGRKIQLCSIDLIADGKLCVRGTVLRIRRESFELPDTVVKRAGRASAARGGPPRGRKDHRQSLHGVPEDERRQRRLQQAGPGRGLVSRRAADHRGANQLARPCARLSPPISAMARRRSWIFARGRSSTATFRSALPAIRLETGCCSTPRPGLGPTAAASPVPNSAILRGISAARRRAS